MDKQAKSVTLSENQRSTLQTSYRRRKVDALVWKRTRAFLLLDAGYDAQTICEILDIGLTVMTQKLTQSCSWTELDRHGSRTCFQRPWTR